MVDQEAAIVTPAHSQEQQGTYLSKLLSGECVWNDFARFGVEKHMYDSPHEVLSGPDETVVKCLGMVQDMLEPEFFQGLVQLGERTPLLLTPLEVPNDTNQSHRDKRQKTNRESFQAYLYYDQYSDNNNNESTQTPSPTTLQLNQAVELVGVWDVPDPILESQDEEDAMDTSSGWEPSSVLPPTTPRLHVLWFQPVSLDAVLMGAMGAASVQSLPPRTLPDPSSTLEQALWMLMHSQAERQDDGTTIRAPHLLGCASLNWVVPDEETGATDSIVHLLGQLVGTPVHVVSPGSCALPFKTHGRLLPTPLQLPASSVVVLDVRKSVPTPAKLSDLQQLCASHLLQYTFEGGVRIPFEADYRILVLSNAATARLLPCTLTVRSSSAALGQWDHPEAFRMSLGHARANLVKVTLDDSVVEQAPQDYCARRPHAQEADLHRWLTLTKLHARSRHSSLATIEDWQAALALDDSMKATLVE